VPHRAVSCVSRVAALVERASFYVWRLCCREGARWGQLQLAARLGGLRDSVLQALPSPAGRWQRRQLLPQAASGGGVFGCT